MPGANLTRVEAEERFDAVHMPIHYDVLLDLGKGARDFTSRTKITFDAKAINNCMSIRVKTETDSLLDNVLYITSMKMKNGFNRSDH